jgi:hypothetical protein
VQVRITNGAGSVNAVLSGVFLDSPGSPPAPSGTAAFVGANTAAQGSWQGAFGAAGEVVPNDSSRLPAWAQLSLSGQTAYTWAASTGDARALQKAANPADRIASTWYSPTGFSLDVNFTDGQAHRLSLYFLDWDRINRNETVSLVDASTGAVLDSRAVSSFAGGEYLSWNVSGHVQVRITNGAGSVNAVLSGVFLD